MIDKTRQVLLFLSGMLFGSLIIYLGHDLLKNDKGNIFHFIMGSCYTGIYTAFIMNYIQKFNEGKKYKKNIKIDDNEFMPICKKDNKGGKIGRFQNEKEKV